jgi:hypothetical protein
MSAQARRRRATSGERPSRPLAKTAHSLIFEPTGWLGDEAFRQIQSAGLKYVGGAFTLDVSDPDVDIDKLISFLKSNVEGFTEKDAERVLEEWRKNEPLRRFRGALSEIAGTKVKELFIHIFALQDAFVRFKPERVDEAKFKELARRFEYLGDGWFQVDLCNHGSLLEIAAEILSLSGKGSGEKADWLAYLNQVCEARIGGIERVKRFLREKYGVEPLSVSIDGDFYVVKLPHLGPEKFKELARRFTYIRGSGFLIRRSEIP